MGKKRVEIVTHCYARELVHYSAALCYQLSSLIFHVPKEAEIEITICCDPNDSLTRRVITFFEGSPEFNLRLIPLDIEYLGRRAIGRNIAAKSSRADIVWFTDADYVFQEDCFDTLVGLHWPIDVTMVFPKRIKIHKDHATGDKALDRVIREPRLIGIEEMDFVDKSYNRAIGGVQIVQGQFARRYGYLDRFTKWQQPVDSFKSCKGDPVYRNFCKRKGQIRGIDLPGVFRMRHTQAAHGRGAKL